MNAFGLRLFLLLISCSCILQAQDLGFLAGITYEYRLDERYGEDERNVFDIFMPASDSATALVIFIHGGGFVMGDKQDAYRFRKQDIRYLLEHKIAFATISYPYYRTDDSLGVGRCLDAVVKALQYIRYHASDYHINKSRVACYGISAGAGSSLYLALHDDFALAGADGPGAESSRIQCAAALETQATYNLYRWLDYIPFLKTIALLKRKEYFNSIANFYGFPDRHSFRPYRDKIPPEYDLLAMISRDDPPVFIRNLQKERFPKDMGIIQHHKRHALVLSSCLRKLQVEHECYVAGQENETGEESAIHFLVSRLK